tara:strand:+ start:1622 stop:2356 length:735 start_codon:yes stop_codon:yes gene_type:complete
MKEFKIEKMRDNTDSFITQKKNNLFDLPMRLLFIAKTGDSKSTTLGNMLLKEEGYKLDFTPDKIFIFSGSLKGDAKIKTIVNQLDIPQENLFDGYDDDVLNVVYEMLIEDYTDNIDEGITNKRLLNSLIIFDDLAFNGTLKAANKENLIKKLFMNSRKFLVSVIVISQKYSSIGTELRENASGLIIGKASNKQVDLIEQDHNYLENKKEFKSIFKQATDIPYGKLVINFSKPELYYNADFKPLV